MPPFGLSSITVTKKTEKNLYQTKSYAVVQFLFVHLILFYVRATLLYAHISRGARGNTHVIMHGAC